MEVPTKVEEKDYVIYKDEKLFYDKVHRTRDYEMFQYVSGNRNTDSNNVRRLVESIKENGQIQPILIDERLFVIDGQNRIKACEQLNKPVKYQITYLGNINSLNCIQEVNTRRKNWIWIDYLKMYCEMGKDNYINYQKLLKRYEFGHTGMLSVTQFNLIEGGSAGPSDFKKGELRIKDLHRTIERLDNIEEYWRLISRAYTNVPGKKRSTPPAKLISALVKVMKHENFNHKTMVMKLKNDVSGFVGINTINGFVAELTKIYNMRNQNKINFN